jgi:hypothetical protein
MMNLVQAFLLLIGATVAEPNDVLWSRPVSGFATGNNEQQAQLSARSSCMAKLFAVQSECAGDGGHITGPAVAGCSASPPLCTHAGSIWQCTDTVIATCETNNALRSDEIDETP